MPLQSESVIQESGASGVDIDELVLMARECVTECSSCEAAST